MPLNNSSAQLPFPVSITRIICIHHRRPYSDLTRRYVLSCRPFVMHSPPTPPPTWQPCLTYIYHVKHHPHPPRLPYQDLTVYLLSRARSQSCFTRAKLSGGHGSPTSALIIKAPHASRILPFLVDSPLYLLLVSSTVLHMYYIYESQYTRLRG